ncbi:hypothetical protein B0H16DRAFT_1460722 [Mycena metata]|uniref:Uncharacterized protein n=1 Tax=Mycena metata TaxID=1033252 RepID=A0AAD7N8T3_9AGAR|nr:hypothetical protein B0H16DRAFT_1460722 [Mycena metata]
MAGAMSIMPRLPKTSRLQIQCNIHNLSPFSLFTYTLPPISANIATLFIQLIPGLSPDVNGQVLDTILGCLTLPFIHRLELLSGRYSHRRLAWPHATFITLSRRSSFKGHLRSLDIGSAVIARDKFIQCLYELPNLVEVTFGDHQLIDIDLRGWPSYFRLRRRRRRWDPERKSRRGSDHYRLSSPAPCVGARCIVPGSAPYLPPHAVPSTIRRFGPSGDDTLQD